MRIGTAAELVFGATGANAGLGWFINSSRPFLDTADAVGGMLVVILLGLLSATATLTRQVNPAPRPVTAVTLAPVFS